MIVTQETKVIEVTLIMTEQESGRLVKMCEYIRDHESWNIDYRQLAADIVDANESKRTK